MVGFCVIVQLSGPGAKPIPSERLVPVWAFRIVIGGSCLAGVIIAGILQKRQKAVELPIDSTQPALAPGTRAITVTYRNTPEAAKRCELFALFNRLSLLVFFIFFGACGAGLAASQLAKFSLPIALLTFPVLHALATSVLMGYIAVLTFAMLKARFPRPDSVRVCTTSLTAEGLQDVTPDKTILIAWKRMRWIKEAGGDIFFSAALNGCYIPRSAFKSREEARRYHRAAVILWKSRGTVWPLDDFREYIDETQSRAAAPEPLTADDDNPYSAPRAPLREEFPSPYTHFIRRVAGVIALEYVVLIPVALTR